MLQKNKFNWIYKKQKILKKNKLNKFKKIKKIILTKNNIIKTFKLLTVEIISKIII